MNEIVFGQKKPYDLKTLKAGVPIMCTKNNNELGLSNGDIGVLIGLKNKRKYLFRKFNNNNEEIVTLIDPSNLERFKLLLDKSEFSKFDLDEFVLKNLELIIFEPDKSTFDIWAKLKSILSPSIFFKLAKVKSTPLNKTLITFEFWKFELGLKIIKIEEAASTNWSVYVLF